MWKAPLKLLKLVFREAVDPEAFSATRVDMDGVAENTWIDRETSDFIDACLPENSTKDAFHADEAIVYLYLGTLLVNHARRFKLHLGYRQVPNRLT